MLRSRRTSAALLSALAAAVVTPALMAGCFQSQEVPAAAVGPAAQASIGGPAAASVGRVDAKIAAPALGGAAAPTEQHGTGNTATTTVTTSDWWSSLLATLESCWTQLLTFLGMLWLGLCLRKVGDRVADLPLRLLEAGLVVHRPPPEAPAVRPAPPVNGSPTRAFAAALALGLGLLAAGCSAPGVELVGADVHTDRIRHGRGRHLRYEARPDGTVILEDDRDDRVNVEAPGPASAGDGNRGRGEP